MTDFFDQSTDGFQRLGIFQMIFLDQCLSCTNSFAFRKASALCVHLDKVRYSCLISSFCSSDKESSEIILETSLSNSFSLNFCSTIEFTSTGV
jgi:hypothetical protein